MAHVSPEFLETFWHPIFQGKSNYPEFVTINVILLIEIKHTILINVMATIFMWKNLNYMLEIDISKQEITSQNIWVH